MSQSTQVLNKEIKNKIEAEANWRATNGHGGVDEITKDNFIKAAEYGYLLAQQQQAGLRWVKATTDPPKNDLYHTYIKWIGDSDDNKFPSTNNWFKSTGWEIIGDDYEVIEWLSESPSLPVVDDKFEFVEWASKHYTYVEDNRWDGDNDETYFTSELYQLFLKSKQQ